MKGGFVFTLAAICLSLGLNVSLHPALGDGERLVISLGMQTAEADEFSSLFEDEEEEIVLDEDMEYDPYWNVPDAIKYIATGNLLDAWVALHENKDRRTAVRIIRDHAIPENSSEAAKRRFFMDTMRNSYVYQLLLAKLDMLKITTDYDEELYDDKGVFWYAKGLEKVYNKKALHARPAFVRGLMAAAELGPKDFQRLEQFNIHIEYDPGMSKYVNSARLGNKFMELPLEQQEIILNVGIATKYINEKVYEEDVVDLYSPTYRMLGILYNLGAFIKTERSFNYGANTIFTDEGADLYQLLRAKFDFDTLELVDISRLGE